MAGRDWTAYRTWHELLDALCAEQGYLDNMTLADQLCAASGNSTQAAYETAVKNLRNWRQGIHIPQRRNFLLLGKILKVDQHDGLRGHWNRLYGQAKARPAADGDGSGAAPVPAAPAAGTRHLAMAGTIAIAAVVAVGAGVLAFFPRQEAERSFIDPSASLEGLQADYVRNVSVQVGDTIVIHGARGNDCGDAPAWETTRHLLPTLVTGTLSDGGLATRYSRQCGGRIPARAIVFTATMAGAEQTSVYGDEIHIRVTE